VCHVTLTIGSNPRLKKAWLWLVNAEPDAESLKVLGLINAGVKSRKTR
jgi:hypothetical protein